MRDTDRLFEGSIPETYDRYLGPLLFKPYARGWCCTDRQGKRTRSAGSVCKAP
jgi:hypothetical protein